MHYRVVREAAVQPVPRTNRALLGAVDACILSIGKSSCISRWAIWLNVTLGDVGIRGNE